MWIWVEMKSKNKNSKSIPLEEKDGRKEKQHMNVKIEKNVPMPEMTQKSKWPWKQMKVGDSFEAGIEAKSMHPTAYRAGTRLEKKFVVRTTGKVKCRVWRVK